MASDKTSRARELERVFQMRRGHAPQISISDDSHHVTEAIGDMYGGDSDNETTRRNSRPLSFLPSPNGDSIQSFGTFEPFDPFPTSPPARSPLRPIMAYDKPATPTSPGGPVSIPQRKASVGRTVPNGQMSPPLSRSNSDTASQQFPLNDIDYESSAAGLAQELSNLQAIRRMSMGVNNADPDLPSFKSNAPPLSPPPLSEEDEQKLFWVPARLHPELAPKEFKTFIEEKVEKIRRRSGDADALSPDRALGREGSGGGLRRKKSMLSRQIDAGSGYKDGAERLERKRSAKNPNGGLPNLQELEHIVEDPVALIRRMSLDAKGSDGESVDGDSPLIAGKIGGLGTLKRSTRTTYRRGSLRKGGPALSRRLGPRSDTDTEDSPATSPTHASIPEVPPLPLGRVQSEPVNGAFESPSNFSRPQRRRSPPTVGTQPRPGSSEEQLRPASSGQIPAERSSPKPKAFHSRIASNGRTTAPLPGYKPQQVPQIIETPPPQEQNQRAPLQLPERLSSRQPPPQPQQQINGPRNYAQPYPPQQQQLQPQQPPQIPQQQRQPPSNRPNRHAQAAQSSPIKPAQTFEEIQHPMPLPGNNTRVDSLSIIPNLPEEKKSEKKLTKKEEGPRKTSWNWFGGDKEKEKKEKEEREKEIAKKVKNKLSKPQEKGHDDARLDVLQASLQANNRGRESVVIDRENSKLEEERKKESARKASGEGKKEKEPGLLSSIFGGGKKKGEKDPSHKRNSARGLSPDPPPRILKPDIDYNWTRFSILEERAIYRMAHIKLANPRRELYSQVLLSNFMYSYLAKVQQMHPQISIGNSKQARQAQAQQKKGEGQPQSQPQQQPQQQQQQQQQHHQQQQPQQQHHHQQQQQQQQQQQPQQQPEEFSQYQRYQQQQQQEQPEESNEWPSYNQQDLSNRQAQENGHHQRPDHSYNQNPRDSHHSQYSANGGAGGGAGGAGAGAGGYKVAGSQNYMGQPKGYAYEERESARVEDDMW